MDLFDLLFGLLDYVMNWRFSVCVFGSAALALFVLLPPPVEPWRWIVGGAIVLVGFIVGWRWDASH